MAFCDMKKNIFIFFLILVLASFLRLWKLDQVPVSLFGDELDVGYHAYSILKTGKDYTGNFMPLHFHSLAEWRTPLFLYASVPGVALFGITPLGVRLAPAVFGILGVVIFYLLVRELTENQLVALISSFVMAISPWHIQYSRAAFEVTMLLLFLMGAVYFLLKALKTDAKWLPFSAIGFGLTLWIYSTAKLFTPLFLIVVILLFRKEIMKLSKKHLFISGLTLLVLGLPLVFTVIFGGGAQRFGYISVLTDPTVENEVGTARLLDARFRGEIGEGLSPNLSDRIFHNKFVLWSTKILNNYYQSFSTDFLFISGDPNLRHSLQGIGQFYKIEFVALILGVFLFFTKSKNRESKLSILSWIVLGAFPAAVTRDGGNHATRLILFLPPLLFLISYGICSTVQILNKKLRYIFIFVYSFLLILCFVFYQHNYWVHYPWSSERWWHAGFNEAISSIKKIEGSYEKVVISTANEPPWIFFAAWYQYPPEKWQANFPLDNKVNLEGFGEVSHIDKFYFGTPKEGLYNWEKVVDKDMLYLATSQEVKLNLIKEPERVPPGINLVKSIAYPSGEPAFYLFERSEK